jgi:hypothetical protein
MWAKLLFYVALYLFASISAAAQIATYQVSLKDSTQNILYVGFPNKIAIENLPANAKVKFDDKDVMPTGNNYVLTPMCRPGNYKLYIYDKNNQEIFAKVYTVYQACKTSIQLGVVKETPATVSDILINPAVVCCPDMMKPFWRIISYDITLVKNGTEQTKTVSADNLNNVPFDKDIQNTISHMKSGDVIIIENIRAYGADEVIRHLSTIWLKIK